MKPTLIALLVLLLLVAARPSGEVPSNSPDTPDCCGGDPPPVPKRAATKWCFFAFGVRVFCW